jgi:hypothetical protein
MIVGEVLNVAMNLMNVSQFNLVRFALHIDADIDTVLVRPDADELYGQSQLPPLGAGEELSVVVAIRARKIGRFRLNLLFSYWANCPPPRYEEFRAEVVAVEQPEVVVERTAIGVRAVAPAGGVALGFSGPFRAMARHVRVEGRVGVFDLVCLEGKGEEVEGPFVEREKFLFWWGNERGRVACELGWPDGPVAVVVNREGEVEVTNVSGATLDEVVVEVRSSGGCLALGPTRKVWRRMGAGDVRKFKVVIVPFEEEAVLPVRVHCGSFEGRQGIMYKC